MLFKAPFNSNVVNRIVVPHEEVEDTFQRRKVRAAISISGKHHTLPMPKCLKGLPPEDLLVLVFDDDGLFGGKQAAMRVASYGADQLHFPDVFRSESKAGWVSLDTIREVLAFGKAHRIFFQEKEDSSNGVVLAHCFAGQSRSPAVMLTCLAQGFGPGREAQAVDALVVAAGDHVRPSPMFILGADWLLGRNGALVRAMKNKGLW